MAGSNEIWSRGGGEKVEEELGVGGPGPGTVRTQEAEGGEAIEVGLCNSADTVAEHGPISTAGSSSPGGEQATLLKILEKMQDKMEQMEKKIDKLLSKSEGEGGREAEASLKKLERLEKEAEDEQEEVVEANFREAWQKEP